MMRKMMSLPRVVTILVALLIAGPFPLHDRASAHERIDFGRLVVIGDSLSAGFQNGALLASQQMNGYASLVARQAGVPLTLPLISSPGIPNVLVLEDPGPPVVIGVAPGVSPGRVDPFLQPMNLAVPGHTVRDALGLRPDFPIDSLTDLVLGLPGLLGGAARSQVEWAEALAPTAAIVWLGNVDALGAALAADASGLTPVADFRSAYRDVMARVAATGAALVVANVPDVTVIPFLTPAELVLAAIAAQTGLPEPVIAAILGLGPGDLVTPSAFALIPGILANPPGGPLPGGVVLDAGEVAQIRAATGEYNAIIAEEAERYGAAHVDIHGLLARIQAEGLVVGGRRLTTEFLGGLFSLDGIHPSDTGYAVIANRFIHAMHTRFAAEIPRVSVERVMREDPLVLPGVGQPAAAHDLPAAAVTGR